MFFPNISASDAKIENPPDDPESILLRGSQLKNELIWPRRLGCRGGAIDLAAAHLVIRALLYIKLKFDTRDFTGLAIFFLQAEFLSKPIWM